MIEDDAGDLTNGIAIQSPGYGLSPPSVKRERQCRTIPTRMGLHQEENQGGKNWKHALLVIMTYETGNPMPFGSKGLMLRV